MPRQNKGVTSDMLIPYSFRLPSQTQFFSCFPFTQSKPSQPDHGGYSRSRIPKRKPYNFVVKVDATQRSPITLCTIVSVPIITGDPYQEPGVEHTISSVHTLRIQTFNLPSTPSTLSNSTPSHQHLRAGFRQNSNSFCAIPTALLDKFSSLTPVRRRARAILQMTALFGSPARWPHWSSWLKPLQAK
jgi:hypothetical protein